MRTTFDKKGAEKANDDVLSLVAPAHYLTTCPRLQRLGICSSGSLSPASDLDAGSSLGQASAVPAGNSPLLVHACLQNDVPSPLSTTKRDTNANASADAVASKSNSDIFDEVGCR